MSQILPYQLEPEYSSSEERNESEAEEEGGEDEALASNEIGVDRLSNTSWCSCERCGLMPTEAESVCCKELTFLSTMIEGTM